MGHCRKFSFFFLFQCRIQNSESENNHENVPILTKPVFPKTPEKPIKILIPKTKS